MRIASIMSSLLIVLALAGGCGGKGDQKLSTFKPDQPVPPEMTARDAGEYELYAAGTPNPVRSITLEKGARFGFRSDGGRAVAFAQRLNRTGSKPVFEDVQIPLPGGDRVEYYWNRVGKAK